MSAVPCKHVNPIQAGTGTLTINVAQTGYDCPWCDIDRLTCERDAAWGETRRLSEALRIVWDRLNELRQDAQELEDAVFKALDVVDPNGPVAADIQWALDAVKSGRVRPAQPLNDSVRPDNT